MMVKVAVVITTYNLENYISVALDSVLLQKTNFNYKILIADDCSSDNTVSILKSYKEKYGDKIELFLSDTNMGSLKNSNRVFDKLQCEYFSFLDGDDYWIGDNRLQKQVDFMDSHPDYMMCGGNTYYLRGSDSSELVIKPKKTEQTYYFGDLLKDQIPFVHTSSILVRNTIFINGLPECYRIAEDTFENCALRGEDFRRILHLEQGPIYVASDVLSVYRIHEKGLWQGSSPLKRTIEAAIASNFYYKFFNAKYGQYFKKKALNSYRILMASLTIDYGILGDYLLDSNCTKLLTGLFMDLQKDNNAVRSVPLIKKKVLSRLLRILFY